MVSDTPSSSRPRHIGSATLALASLVLLSVLVRTAWVGEDALISMRTVDNFVSGHGLRWNIDERVQSYTNPLWVLLLSTVYFFTREIYFTVTAICVCCSLGAFVVLLRKRPPVSILFVLIAFCLSRSLVNFGTSGFENPLSNLLLSVFAVMLLRDEEGETPWARLSVTAALCAMNRLDTMVIFVPTFVLLLAKSWPRNPWKPILLGSLPLLAWLLFSLFYYGFLVPNPALAKLSSSMPLGWYLHFGLRDLAGLFYRDLGSGVVLLLGFLCGGISLIRFLRDRTEVRHGCLATLAAGMLLYCLCVIRVGGDFIIGRYWISPLWVSLILVAYHIDGAWQWWISTSAPRRFAVVLAAVLLIYGIDSVASNVGRRLYDKPGFDILRSIGHKYLKPDWTWGITPSGRIFQKTGEDARRTFEEGGTHVFAVGAIGFSGIAAGREVILIDILGLADPLLARLPPVRRDYDMVGHLERKLPVGYVHARATGSLDLMEPAMRTYYEKLRLVTSGPLWSWERMQAIVELNTGRISPPSQYE